MIRKYIFKMITRILASLFLSLFAVNAFAQNEIVNFEPDYWQLVNAEVVDHLGRKSLFGSAILKDVEFENGVIEVDIALDGDRAYPGVIFRMQSEENFERFYIRPHRAGLYSDALQYMPVINKVGGWQLYSGEGFTNSAVIPANQWNHLKLEIHGTQARVYWNDNEKPALVINDLKHGNSKGKIALLKGVGKAKVYFSNFKYRVDDHLKFDAPPALETPPGMIMEWEISKIFPAKEIDIELQQYPRFFSIFFANWQKVTAEPSGLVDIARYVTRAGQAPELVFARTVFNSEKKQEFKLSFGYSDEITIYLNGKRLYYGMSAYQSRDGSFLGVVGMNDVVYLNAEKGRNEIFMIIKESFGGWGFMAKADPPLTPPVEDNTRLTKVWESSQELLTPESVLYDPKREILYVTSFNTQFKNDAPEAEYVGYISKLSLDGKIIKEKWVSPLHAPAGMAIYKDKLYTAERRKLTEIDLKSGKILNRFPIPNCDFPNDLTIDRKGNIYITDTSPSDWTASKIHKFSKGKFEVWLEAYDTWRPNGIFLHGDKLLFGGNAGDPFLKAVDIKTKKIENIASLGAGVIDGIRVLNNGNYLVSHWEGPLFIITSAGEVTKIMNATGDFNVADFEYIKEKKLLIIPTFLKKKVMAFKLTES